MAVSLLEGMGFNPISVMVYRLSPALHFNGYYVPPNLVLPVKTNVNEPFLGYVAR
jgi:hypothetical protein